MKISSVNVYFVRPRWGFVEIVTDTGVAAAAFRALVGRIAVPSLPPCEIYLPAPLVVRASTRR